MNALHRALADHILGPSYELLVSRVAPDRMRRLNSQYRGVDAPTNVLSFGLTSERGELLLCPEILRDEARAFGIDERDYEAYLVIHGLLHLKGYEHTDEMDERERGCLSRFRIPITF